MTQADPHMPSMAPSHRVCPWWVGYLLVSPLRRLFEHPDRILGSLVTPGMRVLDFGSSMGYFSLPAARLAGPAGKVVCVDLAEKALAALGRRARRAGLHERIETVCVANGEDWATGRRHTFDLALAIHVVHELPNAREGLDRIAACLKPGGTLVLAEPRGHVSSAHFASEEDHVRSLGFTRLAPPSVRRSFLSLLVKAAGESGGSAGATPVS